MIEILEIGFLNIPTKNTEIMRGCNLPSPKYRPCILINFITNGHDSIW